MTGAEHYQRAERHLSEGSHLTGPDLDGRPVNPELTAYHLAAAQAHATLALAAATALTDAGNAMTTGDGGMPAADYYEWIKAAGAGELAAAQRTGEPA